jgi:C-terminal processing protease CtpA/Prc
MPTLNLSGSRRLLAVSVVAGALIAGCGSQESDLSGAIADSNKNLAENGVTLDCPKKVDGGDGTKVKCTLTGKDTGKKVPVEVKVKGDSIVPVDQAAYEQAIHEASGQ